MRWESIPEHFLPPKKFTEDLRKYFADLLFFTAGLAGRLRVAATKSLRHKRHTKRSFRSLSLRKREEISEAVYFFAHFFTRIVLLSFQYPIHQLITNPLKNGKDYACRRVINQLRKAMSYLLYIIAVILIIGWAIGVFAYSLGGLIHVLLILAVVAIIFRLIRGRDV
jgi:ABC-type multidrug transport system fused ATPase/permease subunit